MLKKSTRVFAAFVACFALMLTGCSFDKKGDSGDAGVTELKVAGWGGTQWSRNFNIFAPSSVTVTPGTAYVYEPLVRANRVKAGEVKPYLAESWKFNAEGTELTFSIRKDVKWSDGKPMTADDVVFTFQMSLDGKTRTKYPFQAVTKVDEHTVKVTYAKPAFADLIQYRNRAIAPKHIWESQDAKTWTNPDPVGTGPFKVESFSPQQITFALRDDYWGGKSKGVKTIKLMAMSPDAAKDALKKNEIDFATLGWVNAEEEYVKADPSVRKYNFYPVGTADGVLFNTTVMPVSDPAVRRALRDSVDLEAAAKVTKVGYSVPTKAGLDAGVYKDLLAPNQTQKMDVEKAKKNLADAGWTIQDGKLTKDGKSYDLRYDVYQPYAEWVTTATVMADQWKKNLGLEVKINELADQPFTDVVAKGDYQMMTSSPSLGAQIYDVMAGFDSTKVGTPGANQGGNDMFYKSPRMDAVIGKLAAIQPGEKQDEVKKLAIEAQDILAEDAPFIATMTAGWKGVFNETRWTNFPKIGETDYVPNNTLLADAALNVMNITPKK